MKISYKIMFVLSLILLAACTKSPSERETVIDPDNSMKASEFIDRCTSVRLQTSDSCLVSRIESLRKNNDVIALLSQNQIFLFDYDGRLVGKVNRLGKGNGEYLRIDDYHIIDNKIYILSSMQQLLLEYDMSGIFLNSHKLDNSYYKFMPSDNHTVVLSSANSNNTKYNFAYYDLVENKTTARADKFDSNESFMINDFNAFMSKSDSIMVTHPFDYSVYKLENAKITKKAGFRFNTKDQLPDNKNNMRYIELVDYTSNRNVVKYFYAYTDLGDTQYLVYPLFSSAGIKTHITRIDNSGNNKTMVVGMEKDSSFPYLHVSEYIGLDNDTMIMAAYPVMLLEDEKSCGRADWTKLGMKAEDNPVLFFYKLK